MRFNVTCIHTLPVLFYLGLSTSENYWFQTPILYDVSIGYKQHSTFILYDTDFSILCTKFNLLLHVLWMRLFSAAVTKMKYFSSLVTEYTVRVTLREVSWNYSCFLLIHTFVGIFKMQLNNIIIVCCCPHNHHCQFGRKADHGRRKTLITK